MIFADKKIIYTATEKAKSEILTEIITDNFSDVNTDNIESNSETITVNYYEIPFTDIIEEICGETHDFYLKHNYEAHYFTKGNRLNETDMISEEANLIEVSDNSDDTENVYSKVRVYGASIGDLPIIATSTEDTTNTKGITKEYKIDNKSIITTQQATDFVNAEAEKRSNVPRVGEVSALFLPTLLPGEKLFIAIPREEISPDYYEIFSYRHEFDLTDEIYAKTTVNIKKQKVNLSTLIKGRMGFENKITDNPNPNDMDFSHIIGFDTDSGTHSNTEINEGYLKVQVGQSSGQWISDLIELDDDITALEVKFTGDYLVQQYGATTSYLWYSVDGGTTWHLNPPSGTTVTIGAGRDLKVRVDLNSSDAKVKAVGVFWRY